MADSILQPGIKECYLSGSKLMLHKHHIYFGNPNRRISEEQGFWVWLQANYHNMSPYGVHFDRELDLRLKRECQAKFEETHSREEFIRLIGKNYL